MLLNQHTMLFEEDANLDTSRVGIIDPNCKISSVVEHAFNQASFLCEEYYMMAPELDMTVHNFVEPGKPVEMVYPPNHLHHILFELFKNSMRAIVESRKRGLDLPEIEVLVVKGVHDVSIKHCTEFHIENIGGINSPCSNSTVLLLIYQKLFFVSILGHDQN